MTRRVPLDVDGARLVITVCVSCGVFPSPDGAICEYCRLVALPVRAPVHGQIYALAGGSRLPFGPFIPSPPAIPGTHIYCGICWMYHHAYGRLCRHLSHLEHTEGAA